jgi:hypothetical protein
MLLHPQFECLSRRDPSPIVKPIERALNHAELFLQHILSQDSTGIKIME